MEPNFKKAGDVKWIISKFETPTEEVVSTGDAGTGGESGSQPNIEELDF